MCVAGSVRGAMIDVERVEVVVAPEERATLRVGDVFVKIDSDQTRLDVEVAAKAIVPIPMPEILWRMPPALALAAVRGSVLGHLGQPSTASSAACAVPPCALCPCGRVHSERCHHSDERHDPRPGAFQLWA